MLDSEVWKFSCFALAGPHRTSRTGGPAIASRLVVPATRPGLAGLGMHDDSVMPSGMSLLRFTVNRRLAFIDATRRRPVRGPSPGTQ